MESQSLGGLNHNKKSSLYEITKEVELLVKEITIHKKILIVND